MGCIEARPSNSEEFAIENAELGLCFDKVNPLQVDLVLRKFSYNNKLNQGQLERTSGILGFRICNYGLNLKISDLWNKLRSRDGDINLEDVLIIGILLSKGKPEIKARLFFQIFDVGSQNIIEIDIIREKIEKIIDISLETLGRLVVTGQSIHSNEIKNRMYIEELKKAKRYCVDEVTGWFGENANEESWINTICNYEKGALLEARGWRNFLKRLADEKINANHIKEQKSGNQ
ncbi:unnamed protein product [Blepharisma stoltei]|uniref:Uncharacterized protein n=1 Tax=Blepharisma stoltei TaxID=1481888 RepID=A0AAU9J1E5_9CILI|nr:unnamed protein product [Blepharisma stoltei]